MKEIWINLELYFKRYDFYNFRDFFWIFLDFSDLNFYLKTIKNIKNNKKRVTGPAWMRRGTQGHVAAPRGPAQRAHVARYILYYIMYTYINGSLSSPIWGGSYP